LDEGKGDLLSLPSSNQTLLLVAGIDKATSEAALRLAKSHPDLVKAFVGVHPSEALREQEYEWLPGVLEKATGAGEIGLDPKYSETGERSAQKKALLAQLKVAQDHKKPIQVHSRGAERGCIDALDGFTLGAVLMHWFQDEETLQEVIGKGYYVSFGPAVLYSNRLQRMAARCDQSLVLVETDSPVAYKPLGGVHGSFLVPSVVFKLGEVWGKSFDEARVIIMDNSRRYLGLPEKG
jgi:TatD DNase family protein